LNLLRTVLGVAVPAVAVLLAVAETTGGCTLEETTHGRTEAVEKPEVSARLPAEYTKLSFHSDTRAARTLVGLGGESFFGGRGRGSGETPFEQLLGKGDEPVPNNGLCPPDMASINDAYCVDRYEASLLEILPNGDERTFSSYAPLDGHVVRAVSEPGVYPRGYVSAIQAERACGRSGKRLCKPAEWRNACMGPKHQTYGYSSGSEPGRCNDHGRSPMGVIYAGENLGPREKWDSDHMNAPELNQVEGTLARSGEHAGCTNEYGVYDMVGNLHEWVADPDGTFQGGYYLDTRINGEGCTYRTTAHAAWYHDYSTGFRCCADVAQ
jgi:formylglycine-generating enzyme